MAMQPCQFCHRRFIGPASRAYVAILDGNERWESKPRLCFQHYLDLVGNFLDVDGRVVYESNAPWQDQRCLVCHSDVAGRYPQSVFCTGYPARGEREDFFAPVCRDCRPSAQILFSGT